jgi:SulP family sulfate permease
MERPTVHEHLAWLARRLPGLALLRGYERAWLRPDLVAGLTVGAMLLPQSMAYAELARLPASAGFHAALASLVTYAFVGSSRHLGVGPEPGTAILAATGVGALAGGDPARYVTLMATLAALVGALSLVGALLRLGFLAELLSRPVLVGYITGVGLTLLSSQLGKATGVVITADGFFGRVAALAARLGEVRPLSLGVCLGTLAVVLTLRRLAPKVPGALVGVTLATLASVALDLPSRGVRSVGDVAASLPRLHLPSLGLAELGSLLPLALGIALVGYTDNVLTARSVAARLGYRVDASQELVALGVINVASSLVSGFPVSSGASRTAVPASLGSKTQLVSLVAAGFVVLALLGLGPAMARLPEAALAAVIVAAALAIVDVAGFRRLYQQSKPELAIALAGMLAVMVLDVLGGVLLAVGASVLLALGRIAVPHDAILGHEQGLDGWVDADRYGLEPTRGLLVYRFDAPLFFANATRFRERLGAMLEKNPGREEWVVLDFEGVGEIDVTALDMLEELSGELSEQGMVVAVARANTAVHQRLERAKLAEPEGPLKVFATINAAVRAFEARQEPEPFEPRQGLAPRGTASREGAGEG